VVMLAHYGCSPTPHRPMQEADPWGGHRHKAEESSCKAMAHPWSRRPIGRRPMKGTSLVVGYKGWSVRVKPYLMPLCPCTTTRLSRLLPTTSSPPHVVVVTRHCTPPCFWHIALLCIPFPASPSPQHPLGHRLHFLRLHHRLPSHITLMRDPLVFPPSLDLGFRFGFGFGFGSLSNLIDERR
jgi:hypothetical protein